MATSEYNICLYTSPFRVQLYLLFFTTYLIVFTCI